MKGNRHQEQEAQRVLNKMSLKRATPRYIVIKMGKVKNKERIIKAARERQLISYKGNPIRLSADFSEEILQARRKLQNIFKVLKEKNLQPGIFYLEMLSFRIEGEDKSFSDKQKLREFNATKPALQIGRAHV